MPGTQPSPRPVEEELLADEEDIDEEDLDEEDDEDDLDEEDDEEDLELEELDEEPPNELDELLGSGA